jgi:DNA polymerase-3 subunit alpha
MEILIKAGALDSLGPNRAQHMAALERAVQSASAKQRDKARGQKSLFGDEADDAGASPGETLSLPEAPDWTHAQKLVAEREVLGFYLTSHPLTEHADKLGRFASHVTRELVDLEDRAEVSLAGMVSSIKKAQTKKPSRNGNTRYVNFDFEDPHGMVRCILWPEEFARMGHLVELDAICFIKGRVDRRGREPNLIVNQIMTLDEAEKTFTDRLAIKFQNGLHDEKDMIRVRDILNRHPGLADVILLVDTPDDSAKGRSLRYVMQVPNSMRVACNAELRSELAAALGENHFRFHAAPVKKNGNGSNVGR